MGFFKKGLFKKKKNIGFSSESHEAMPKEAGGPSEFDKLLAEAPPPSLDLKKAEDIPAPEIAPIPPVPIEKPIQDEPPVRHEELGKGLPAFKPVPMPEIKPEIIPKPEPIPKPEQKPDVPKEHIPAINEDFELPDFNDQELKELEELKTITQDINGKSKGVKKPIVYPKSVSVGIVEEKFIDVKTDMQIKEDINKIKELAKNSQEAMDGHINIRKDKDDKYHSLTISLNTLQDKLILMDNKLFENK